MRKAILPMVLLATCYLLALVLLGSVIKIFPVTIAGKSMEPNYKQNSVYLVFKTKNIDRGDVVVYEINGKRYVHRIIGTPGDGIRIANCVVFVNGGVLHESYLVPETCTNGGDVLSEENSITISDKNYFVLGDDRENSSDSRFSEVGLISQNSIIGKLVIKIN